MVLTTISNLKGTFVLLLVKGVLLDFPLKLEFALKGTVYTNKLKNMVLTKRESYELKKAWAVYP